jgi:superoxide dismutase
MLPKLPYKVEEGLQPLFSSRALDIHFNKIYYPYIVRLNQLVENTEHEVQPLEKVIAATSKWADDALINSVASEVWNHSFFFRGLIPGGRSPSQHLLKLFDLHFNGFDKFQLKVFFSHFVLSLFYFSENESKLIWFCYVRVHVRVVVRGGDGGGGGGGGAVR